MTTSNEAFHELFQRYEGNPILTARDWPYPTNTVFNPGAVRLKDGQTLLLVRVEDRRGISHLSVARSRNGLTDWDIARGAGPLPRPGAPPGRGLGY